MDGHAHSIGFSFALDKVGLDRSKSDCAVCSNGLRVTAGGSATTPNVGKASIEDKFDKGSSRFGDASIRGTAGDVSD